MTVTFTTLGGNVYVYREVWEIRHLSPHTYEIKTGLLSNQPGKIRVVDVLSVEAIGRVWE